MKSSGQGQGPVDHGRRGNGSVSQNDINRQNFTQLNRLGDHLVIIIIIILG